MRTLHAAALIPLAALALSAPGQAPVRDAVVTVHTERPAVNRFDPLTTFGAGLDGHSKGVVRDIYTAVNIKAMKSAGFTMATYRLRTELGIEAWHWNAAGRWSDSAHRRGYWTSSDTSSAPVLLAHGYRLPRRGNTIDQADNTNYSRLDDGDTATFWKSDPYLDRRFTGTADSLLPQWVIVDLGEPRPVSAIRIHWGEPHAAAFRVQYWSGVNVHDVDENPPGRWVTFAGGAEGDGRGGVELRRLADAPVSARFVRLVLTASAHDAPRFSVDPRDSAGYAIRELEIGTMDGTAIHDEVRHGASHWTQSVTYASSTDSWHRAEDIDLDLEQPGFDRVFGSGLTQGRPLMVPVPVLYGTPENAAAEVRFLRRRGYAVGRIEMGEEPDGQYVTPEDYAELYAQTARAIRADWPDAPLGGPAFQGLESRVMFAWPSDSAGGSWIPRFLAALRQRGRTGDFNFFSFEWYPFDDVCAETAPQLASASARLADRLAQVERDGVDAAIPRVIAEYGYSAFAGRAQVDIEGALLNADIVGRFLTVGGRAAYLYGWEPSLLDESPRCGTWGNNMLFLADARRRIRYRMATFYGAQLLTREWVSPRGGEHAMFAAESDARDADGNELLSAYVVRRPDGTWSAMLVNKDPARSYRVALDFGSRYGGAMSGVRTVLSYSRAQYRWQANAAHGAPSRDDPPSQRSLAAGAALIVPPYSITVVRGGRTD
jgi:hypothetical protein